MELIRPRPVYGVRNAPVYGNLELTAGSQNRLTSPQAFEFAKEHGGKLQGLGHAIVARAVLYKDDKETKQGLDGSNEYQKTSTISLKFKDGEKVVAAFIELDDDERSLALVQEGYTANNSGRELIKPLSDPLVSRLIEIARESGRICPALTKRLLELSTIQKKGKSDYGYNTVIVAAVGSPEVAELNAGYLQEHGYNNGFFWDFTTSELEEKLSGTKDHAIIRPVGLGGGSYVDVYGIDASYGNFGIVGRARGVVHGEQKISSGNKGRRTTKSRK